MYSGDKDNGYSFEESNSALSDVIILSSDDEQPPRPKRAKSHPTTAFSMTEMSGYHQSDDSDLSLMMSTHNGQYHGLNDSLEKLEVQHSSQSNYPTVSRFQCKTESGEVQMAMHMDEHSLALPVQPIPTFNHPASLPVVQHQSNSIYDNLNTLGSELSKDCSKTDSGLFDSSTSSSSNSAVNFMLSNSWESKTPTQKQIRESVLNSITRVNRKPGSHDPFPPPNIHVTNTVRKMARDYSTGPPPPGFIAGAVVRNTPPTSGDDRTTLAPVVERTPVKSLSLGNYEERKTIRLQSDDRTITSGSHTRDPIPNQYNDRYGSSALGTTSYHWQRPTVTLLVADILVLQWILTVITTKLKETVPGRV